MATPTERHSTEHEWVRAPREYMLLFSSFVSAQQTRGRWQATEWPAVRVIRKARPTPTHRPRQGMRTSNTFKREPSPHAAPRSAPSLSPTAHSAGHASPRSGASLAHSRAAALAGKCERTLGPPAQSQAGAGIQHGQAKGCRAPTSVDVEKRGRSALLGRRHLSGGCHLLPIALGGGRLCLAGGGFGRRRPLEQLLELVV